MTRQIFSGCVQVEIQGPKVLRLLRRTIKVAEYEVVGFEKKVLLQDSRINGLQAIDYMEATGDTSFFPEKFSSPAFAHILTDDSGILRIILSDTHQGDLDFILWIAVGISDEIPNYNYLCKWIEFLQANKIGIISIFSRTLDEDDIFPEEDYPENKEEVLELEPADSFSESFG